APTPVAADASAVACVSANGRLLVFGLDEMKTLSSGGRGVNLMELEKNEKLVAAQAISQKGVVVHGTGNMSKPKEIALSGEKL
ncbi:DNA gyrase C-terminal beta-propeller domain-containing protein, partial [Acinetobacter baumannii]